MPDEYSTEDISIVDDIASDIASDTASDIASLKEKLTALHEQKRISEADLRAKIDKQNKQIATLFEQLNKRIHISKQSFSNMESDDPSIGICLTDQQRGKWEGRIEVWEYALLIAREVFNE